MAMIAVAHRLAMVQNADVVYVLREGGHVVKMGSHRQLSHRGVCD